ncbi:BON domain-containing protein [Granulosicoccus antarcticus]|uniref:BON domain-containing protein n=1 Tax=Granulosicoccus antarcticus IMCC3135 TaxID=1192854 RepID=A0A2Z2NGW8_9GAMM|nr:BON domain-containing protein [Granulosicoccus antarcticus]ASJ70536.1 hypothetical protein IMCC3135_02110 [Granulosicoccus antarcticus IMCC3135]
MTLRNTIAATTIVLATVFSGVASANISTGNIHNDVQSAIGAGNVSVSVKDGVAILFGSVDSRIDSNAAARAAASFAGIDKVINRINVSK